MDDNGELSAESAQALADAAVDGGKGLKPGTDEAIDVTEPNQQITGDLDVSLDPFLNGDIRTLDGEIAGDEFTSDAINYQILLRKIDTLLERLKLDA